MQRILLIGVVLLLVFMSCNESENKSAVLSVRLTDAPADYEEVLIDVQEVQINIKGEGENGWSNLENVNSGIYNLLEFTNGMDTLLVEQELPAGKISQMRLVLGENNRLKKDGDYYDLATPSSQQSGLKFNIHADLTEGITYRMWIDFDAGRSIVEKGNGEYSLKPVLRTYTEATSGAIKGLVLPLEARPYVMAISTTDDTLGTYTDTLTGKFLISGVPAGIFKVEIKPTEGYQEKVFESIEVVLGETYDMDTISLELVN